MALVDYDSSDSDQEEAKFTAPPREKTAPSSKPAFEKIVDKTNPGVVRVKFAEPSKEAKQEDASDAPERPAKRAKTGAFGGFNSFLPAPKRPGATVGGLGKGVNLKTGATPGFTREPMTDTTNYDHGSAGSNELEVANDTNMTGMASAEKTPAVSDGTLEKGADEQPKKKATIFKPLSVTRKSAMKKQPPTGSQGTAASMNNDGTRRLNSEPKVSLFSIGDVPDTTNPPPASTGAYQPLVYSPGTPNEPEPNSNHTQEPIEPQDSSAPQPPPFISNQADSLDTIAADLNLSASARRQLLGRHHQRNSRNDSSSSIKITHFNTDEEYAANEALRQSGEIVQHNAVRGIAPGKHSLKQLVNAATTQKDALEEQFAAGRRNKSEAGAKYGW